MCDQTTEHSNPPPRPIPCDAPMCKNEGTRWFGETSVRICENKACREHFNTVMNKLYENENDNDQY